MLLVIESIVMCFVLLIVCVVGIAFQMAVIYAVSDLFDRIFIDWYWVTKTKAWIVTLFS